MKNEIPTEEDWEDYNSDMDQRDAYEVFFGRTNEEMQKEYFKNVRLRATDLRFMPVIPFRYYMLGFRDFVMRNKFDNFDTSTVADCFINLVEEKLKDEPDYILPIMKDLLSTIEYVANNQDAYNAPIHIYGDFQDNLKSIQSLIKTRKAQ
jgi:hypothetical protein